MCKRWRVVDATKLDDVETALTGNPCQSCLPNRLGYCYNDSLHLQVLQLMFIPMIYSHDCTSCGRVWFQPTQMCLPWCLVLEIWLEALQYSHELWMWHTQFSVEHTLSCPKGGFPSIRHNEIWDLKSSLGFSTLGHLPTYRLGNQWITDYWSWRVPWIITTTNYSAAHNYFILINY